jgi:hypothetical protein
MIDWSATPRRSAAAMMFWLCLSLFGPAAVVVLVAFGVPDLIRTMQLPSAAVAELGRLGLIALFVGPLLATPVVRASISAARRELSKFPEAALFDTNAPLLYLRQFSRENPSIIDGRIEERQFTFSNPVTQLLHDVMLLYMGATRDRTFETLLAGAFKHIGPLICLSDPKQRRRGGEAMRLRIKDENWQEAVMQLASASNLVLISYEGGANLDWEVQQILEKRERPVLIHFRHLNDAWLRSPIPDPRGSSRKVLIPPPDMPKYLAQLLVDYPDLPIARSGRAGLMLLVNPNGQKKARRVGQEWSDTRKVFKEMIEFGRIKPIPNPRANIIRSWALTRIRNILGWGPAVSMLVVGALLCWIAASAYSFWAFPVGFVIFISVIAVAS